MSLRGDNSPSDGGGGPCSYNEFLSPPASGNTTSTRRGAEDHLPDLSSTPAGLDAAGSNLRAIYDYYDRKVKALSTPVVAKEQGRGSLFPNEDVGGASSSTKPPHALDLPSRRGRPGRTSSDYSQREDPIGVSSASSATKKYLLDARGPTLSSERKRVSKSPRAVSSPEAPAFGSSNAARIASGGSTSSRPGSKNTTTTGAGGARDLSNSRGGGPSAGSSRRGAGGTTTGIAVVGRGGGYANGDEDAASPSSASPPGGGATTGLSRYRPGPRTRGGGDVGSAAASPDQDQRPRAGARSSRGGEHILNSSRYVRRKLSDAVEEELHDALQEIGELCKQIEKLRASLERKSEEVERARRTANVLESKNRALEAEFHEVKNTGKKQVDILKEEVSRLRETVDVDRRKIGEAFLGKLETLEKDKDKATRDLKQQLMITKDEGRKAALEIDFLKTSLEQREVSLSEHLNAFTELSDSHRELAQKLDKMQDESFVAEKELYDRSREIQTKTGFVLELQDLCKKLQTELRESVKKAEKVEAELEKKEELLKTVQERLSDAEARLRKDSALERELFALKEEVHQLTVSKSSFAGQVSDLQKTVLEKDKRIEGLQEEMLTARAEASVEKKEKMEKEAEITTFQKDILAQCSEIEQLKDLYERSKVTKMEKRALEDRLSEFRSIHSQHLNEIDVQKRAMEVGDSKLRDVQKKLDEVSSQKASQDQELEAKNKWIAEARVKLVNYDMLEQGVRSKDAELQRYAHDVETLHAQTRSLQSQSVQREIELQQTAVLRANLERCTRLLQDAEVEMATLREAHAREIRDIVKRKMGVNGVAHNYLNNSLWEIDQAAYTGGLVPSSAVASAAPASILTPRGRVLAPSGASHVLDPRSAPVGGGATSSSGGGYMTLMGAALASRTANSSKNSNSANMALGGPAASSRTGPPYRVAPSSPRSGNPNVIREYLGERQPSIAQQFADSYFGGPMSSYVQVQPDRLLQPSSHVQHSVSSAGLREPAAVGQRTPVLLSPRSAAGAGGPLLSPRGYNGTGDVLGLYPNYTATTGGAAAAGTSMNNKPTSPPNSARSASAPAQRSGMFALTPDEIGKLRAQQKMNSRMIRGGPATLNTQ
ncbi:unnamed protein product [Amoebophrya sp. A25]|nr:unnamed protein product [Amoebophrya sp. A25]|eukprot:GSA25T00011816001.1